MYISRQYSDGYSNYKLSTSNFEFIENISMTTKKAIRRINSSSISNC